MPFFSKDTMNLLVANNLSDCTSKHLCVFLTRAKGRIYVLFHEQFGGGIVGLISSTNVLYRRGGPVGPSTQTADMWVPAGGWESWFSVI
jgi:hypothetical protein